MPPKTKRVPRSKLKWLYDCSVRQLVYAAKLLKIVHEGLEKAQLIEAIIKHKRIGWLRQCDVVEMRPTWDEVWDKVDWGPWERGWRFSYDNLEHKYEAAEQGRACYPHRLAAYQRKHYFGTADDNVWPEWAREQDIQKSKKLYAQALGHNWVHGLIGR